MLAVLFLARMAMAFQFQSVAALSPWLIREFGLGLAEIGLLIGLYLAPGALVAIPGGALAARIGETRIVALSLFAMLGGGLLCLVAPTYESFAAGRLIAGVGGAVVNIVMTKMLVDWFAGREISTALAIFVNSWPVGIALALLALPMLAGSNGFGAAQTGVLTVIVAGLVLFLAIYRPAEQTEDIAPVPATARFPIWPLICAGLVWALYNSALAMVFSFGAATLMERGWPITSANSATSLYMLVLALAIPAGGYLADRTGRGHAVILASGLGYIVLMPLVSLVPDAAVIPILVASSALFALAAGPIMALPSAVLAPGARNLGMGIFFAIYYLVMMVAPRVAGGIADATGIAGTAFTLGAVQVAGSLICLGLFRASIPRPSARPQ